MNACEDCGHRFQTGEIGRFAQDDPEPGAGYWLCAECWELAQREEAAQISRQAPAPHPQRRAEIQH